MTPRATHQMLDRLIRAMLLAAHADAATVDAVARAIMHATLLGIDSHGFRLTEGYVRGLASGEIIAAPDLTIETRGASGRVDARGGHGARAAYAAMDHATALAEQFGVACVSISNSTHFSAAGAYACHAADRGMIGLAVSNADPAVLLHGARTPFHGTNPIAAAAPVPDGDHWLLDMATSSIPFNRVNLFETRGWMLPSDVAVDAAGVPTVDAAAVRALLPLGGSAFGFKGAGLAGLVTILSAILSGATIDPDMSAGLEAGSQPLGCGHLVIAIDPAHFVGRDAFGLAMRRYIRLLTDVQSVDPGQACEPPGAREWRTRRDRQLHGIPVDADILMPCLTLAAEMNIDAKVHEGWLKVPG